VRARRVERAGLLLQADRVEEPRRTVFVRDANDGAFVTVPCERAGWLTQPVALSRDGRRVACLLQSFTGPGGYLSVYTLADGSEVRFDPGADGEDVYAAFSPDGRAMAVLSAAEVRGSDDEIVADRLIVGVIDLVTGNRRRLWSGPGLAPAERTIGWSPDGRFLVAAHADLDEQPAVTVLDAAGGHLVNEFTERDVLACPQGAWFSDRELVMFPEYVDYDATPLVPTLVVDVVTGEVRRPAGTGDLPYGCWGLADGRMIGSFSPHTIGAAALDGSDARVLLTYPQSTQVRVIDIAPAAAPLR
jgi:dipeptidyl aminopeptidase/acylaminoacyl peptidase